jgi:hypothetical protein
MGEGVRWDEGCCQLTAGAGKGGIKLQNFGGGESTEVGVEGGIGEEGAEFGEFLKQTEVSGEWQSRKGERGRTF